MAISAEKNITVGRAIKAKFNKGPSIAFVPNCSKRNLLPSTEKVNSFVSSVSKIDIVRKKMVEIQRNFSKNTIRGYKNDLIQFDQFLSKYDNTLNFLDIDIK